MPDRILVDTSAWIELFHGAKTNKEVEVINQLLEAIHYIEITSLT